MRKETLGPGGNILGQTVACHGAQKWLGCDGPSARCGRRVQVRSQRDDAVIDQRNADLDGRSHAKCGLDLEKLLKVDIQHEVEQLSLEAAGSRVLLELIKLRAQSVPGAHRWSFAE